MLRREGYSRFFLGILDPKKTAANEFNSVPIVRDLLGVQTPDATVSLSPRHSSFAMTPL